MQCPFCKGKEKEHNKNFDSPAEHLVIVLKDGHTHIHGPFENEYVIREMAKSLLAEMEKNGIKYIPAFENRIEK